MPLSDVIHIPTPGDHYSPATGSAVMTIIYELARVQARQDGRSRIVVTHGTRHDYPIGECIEVRSARSPTKWQKAADLALARVRLPRMFGSAAYRPACDAIPPNFDGPVFIHNSPSAVRLFRKKRAKARICLWAHNELFRTYRPWETRAVVQAADRVICVSEYIAADLRSRLGNAPKLLQKVKVVHSGVDAERFQPGAAECQDEVPVVLFLGRVISEKGPDLLLKAARIMHQAGHSFRIRIVGSGNFSAMDPLTPYERELRKLAEPMGDCVEFQPFVDRSAVPGEYQRAAIFCAPSIWKEPFGLTLAEAMACGLPVVTSRRGGIPEVGGDAVRYVDVTNAGEFAAALANLITRPKERRILGDAARRRVMSRMRWEDTYDALVVAVSDTGLKE